MIFNTKDEAVEALCKSIWFSYMASGCDAFDDFRKVVDKSLTHRMIFELYRLSPLKDSKGEYVIKDGKVVGV